MTLKIGDKIEFKIKKTGEVIEAEVDKNYLHLSWHPNFYIFQQLNIINKMQFVKNVVWYEPLNWDFPVVKNLRDLEKVVGALKWQCRLKVIVNVKTQDEWQEMMDYYKPKNINLGCPLPNWEKTIVFINEKGFYSYCDLLFCLKNYWHYITFPQWQAEKEGNNGGNEEETIEKQLKVEMSFEEALKWIKEPYKTQVMENKGSGYTNKYLLKNFFGNSMVWSNTKEGGDYWVKIDSDVMEERNLTTYFAVPKGETETTVSTPTYWELKADYWKWGVKKIRKWLYEWNWMRYKSLKELHPVVHLTPFERGKNCQTLWIKSGDKAILLKNVNSYFKIGDEIVIVGIGSTIVNISDTEWNKRTHSLYSLAPIKQQTTQEETKKEQTTEDLQQEIERQASLLKEKDDIIKRERDKKARELEQKDTEVQAKIDEALKKWKEEEKKKLLTTTNKWVEWKKRGKAWDNIEIDDKNYNIIKHSFKVNMPLLLKWPSWTWKSSIVRALAEDEGVEVVQFNANSNTTVENLLGHKILVGWNMEFEDWPLTDAVRNWKIFQMDEINTTDTGVQFILNGLLEKNGKLSVQGNGNEVIKPHPNFRFYGTYNPWYLWTKAFTTSIMSRFVTIEVKPLDKNKEKALLLKKFPSLQKQIDYLVELEVYLRNKKDFSYDVSTRDLEQALMFAEHWFSTRDAIEATIINSCQLELDRKLILDYLNN